MATVNVTNWDEFYEAISGEGNIVVCPENAVWDMNEMHPAPITGHTYVSCAEIRGNGLEIKNLVVDGGVVFNAPKTVNGRGKISVSNLKITNALVASGYGTYSDSHAFIVLEDNDLYMESCTFSGILSNSVPMLISARGSTGGHGGGISGNFLSVNVEMQSANAREIPIALFNASRFIVNIPNAKAFSIGWASTMNNEIVLYAPQVVSVTLRGTRFATLRGDLPVCERIEGEATSIYSVDSVPNAVASGIVGVTDEQMKNAAYLRSIGFIIGTE